MNEPKKHHYLPVFYLRQWAGDDDKLVQYTKSYLDVVKPRRLHPNAIGYVNKLYAIEALPDELAYEFEREFLSPVDSRAAEALKVMLDANMTKSVTPAQRKAWARFMNSLLVRMPEDIANMRQVVNGAWDQIKPMLEKEYRKYRKTTAPDTLDDFFLCTARGIASNSGYSRSPKNDQQRTADQRDREYGVAYPDV